jgi:F-type H+-transporting ATPase subunit alpha
LERAARLATKFVVTKQDFTEAIASEKDAVDGKVYTGPLAHHEAEQAIKEMKDPENYRVMKVAGTGGSLTALPIIETLLGDVSAYVPTNVISITDGQIYLENNLFNAGIRPAINVGISVSRVGGDAQTKAMKQVAGRLRLDMAAFRELAAFAQFGSDLDKATLSQLNRGRRMQEILKQPQYEPVALEHQVMIIFAATQGFADEVPVEAMNQWQGDLVRFLDLSYPEIGKEITETKRISPENEARLREALSTFKTSWQA